MCCGRYQWDWLVRGYGGGEKGGLGRLGFGDMGWEDGEVERFGCGGGFDGEWVAGLGREEAEKKGDCQYWGKEESMRFVVSYVHPVC